MREAEKAFKKYSDSVQAAFDAYQEVIDHQQKLIEALRKQLERRVPMDLLVPDL